MIGRAWRTRHADELQPGNCPAAVAAVTLGTESPCPLELAGAIVPGVDLGFRGEVADLYHRYRHGYPSAVLDALAGAFRLTGQDVVVDLGCAPAS